MVWSSNIYVGMACVMSALLFGVADAGLVLQPSQLSPGDPYRLVFTTSTGRNATSAAIGDYNDFVQSAADGSALSALGQTWTAIAATTSVNAHDNTMTNPAIDGVGVPIYLVDGTKVADNYGDLWDNSLDAAISVSELGTLAPELVWTGYWTDGTSSLELRDVTLGSSLQNSQIGSSQRADSGWYFNHLGQHLGVWTESHSLYAMSGVITAVPEPNAFMCIGVLMCIMAAIRWWRKAIHPKANAA